MSFHCPRCLRNFQGSEGRPGLYWRKLGTYYRSCDQKLIQRYQCLHCQKSFSSATFERPYRQRKRHLNPQVFEFLASGMSQRRGHRLLRINRKTLVRKMLFLARLAPLYLREMHLQCPLVTHLEFDDLETFEHSKYKPLSVTVAVVHKRRWILGFQVSQMPAKGLLAKRSRQKYGPRKDKRPQARARLFSEIREYLAPDALICSDQNPHYTADVKKYFPEATHQTVKGKRGCVTGQGELKEGAYDPLFSLNHTCAMMRAQVNRLFRKTWNTTKKAERLALHLNLYVLFHNMDLLRKEKTIDFPRFLQSTSI